jgi:hypothetical protein
VQGILDTIWRLTDVDKSGDIDMREYLVMHENMWVAVHGYEDFDANEHMQHAIQDWHIDRGGVFDVLDYTRFTRCWWVGVRSGCAVVCSGCAQWVCAVGVQ